MLRPAPDTWGFGFHAPLQTLRSTYGAEAARVRFSGEGRGLLPVL